MKRLEKPVKSFHLKENICEHVREEKSSRIGASPERLEIIPSLGVTGLDYQIGCTCCFFYSHFEQKEEFKTIKLIRQICR